MAQLAEKSETEIANRALSHIKKPSITSIDDDTGNTADVLRLHFAPVRDALQRGYPWNFNKDYATLPASADTNNSWKFQYAYDLPEDCLWVREVKDAGEDEWEVSGQRILSNLSAPLKICYSKRVAEVPFWDELFRVAMAMQLAAAIAPELATDEGIGIKVEKKAEELLLAAYPADAAEGASEKVPDTSWVTNR